MLLPCDHLPLAMPKDIERMMDPQYKHRASNDDMYLEGEREMKPYQIEMDPRQIQKLTEGVKDKLLYKKYVNSTMDNKDEIYSYKDETQSYDEDDAGNTDTGNVLEVSTDSDESNTSKERPNRFRKASPAFTDNNLGKRRKYDCITKVV